MLGAAIVIIWPGRQKTLATPLPMGNSRLSACSYIYL